MAGALKMGTIRKYIRRVLMSGRPSIWFGYPPWLAFMIVEQAILPVLLDAITQSYVLEVRPFLDRERVENILSERIRG